MGVVLGEHKEWLGIPFNQGLDQPRVVTSWLVKYIEGFRLLKKILMQNFQGIFLRVKHHPWHQRWPCPPSLWSGMIKRPPCTPFLTSPSWHTSIKYISTKLLGYLPQGQIRSSMTSRMNLSSNSLIRNTQHPPHPPSWLPITNILLMKISTWKFYGIFLRGGLMDLSRLIKIIDFNQDFNQWYI